MLNLIYSGAAATFCKESANIWQVLGYIFMVFKIVIPLLLIIWGMIDLGKAVVASKDDEIKTAISKLAKRAIAGILIFFLPTLVGIIFNLVDQTYVDASGNIVEKGSAGSAKAWAACSSCLTKPGSCDLDCVDSAGTCNPTDATNGNNK